MTTQSATLQFDFEGDRLQLPMAELEPTTSPFTGRRLRNVQTVATVAPKDAETAKRLLAASPVMDHEGTLWSGQLDVESYSDDGPRSLTITWSEKERLVADVVEFEGLALRPTRYEERLNDDGSIAIAFQATLTTDETEALRALMPATRSELRYWPVRRRGISDDPRRMRLGRVLWQQFDDRTVGHDVTLVDEAFDSSTEQHPLLSLTEPMLGNLVRHVSSLIAQYDTLLTELQATSALTAEAVERIRASAESVGPLRRHAFYEVFDLSEW